MTPEEATALLRSWGWIDDHGAFSSGMPYVSELPPHLAPERVCLDGDFTIEQLLAIATYLEARRT